MYDLISIGAVGIDLYFKGESLSHNVDHFELAFGGKYFTDHFHEGLGGGGANVAIGVSRNGLKTALFSEIGNNPFKSLIHEKLDKEKVNYRYLCQYEDDYINISSILLNGKGEKTIINYRTPHQQLLEHRTDLTKLAKTRAVYLANMPNIALTERFRILTYAKHHGVQTFMNLGVVDCRRPKDQLENFLKKVDVLIVNTHEFADLIKEDFQNIHWREHIMSRYLPSFKTKLMVVTDGEKGSYAYIADNSYYQEAIKPTKVVDTTGAGDAYSAGFIAEYLKTSDIRKSMEHAARYASHKLSKIGAT